MLFKMLKSLHGPTGTQNFILTRLFFLYMNYAIPSKYGTSQLFPDIPPSLNKFVNYINFHF